MAATTPRRRVPGWALACTAAFLAYFALLLYCDLVRPESEGVWLAFGRAPAVERVAPGSAASRAGLRPGDRIVAIDGQPFRRKIDWEAVASNLEFGRPLVLDVERGGSTLRLEMAFGRAGLEYWRDQAGASLLVVRFVQLVTLALGALVLVRRPGDRVAALGAWLLGSIGVFCVVLPFRFAAAWRGLWWPIGAALWLPFASTLLVGALLLTFFLQFPVRRVRSTRLLVLAWVPLVAASMPYLRYYHAVVYAPETARGRWDGYGLLLAVSFGYLVAALAVAVWSYRRLDDETERRRVRVLLMGGVFGCLAAGAIVVGWWRTGMLGLFNSWWMPWLLPFLLASPVSFAYATLRHRLFDVRLIVRQGVRYALARRLLLSLVPALLLVLVIDLWMHRDQAMKDVVVGRALPYLVLVAAAIAAQYLRQPWLDALDRRFFREQYDAQRLLSEVADDLREAGGIDRVAAGLVGQVELALHPRFVALLLRPAGSDDFRPLAAAPPGTGPARLPGGGRLVAVVRALGRPLEISARGTGWLAAQLPEVEQSLVADAGIELLVPVATHPGGPEALIALGARRSEEPYAREDQDLLQAIAGNLGLLLSREETRQGAAASFYECPRCGACYDEPDGPCPADGAALTPVALPRLLVARYRLDSRLGRGGMGTVYSASDLALRRPVAVKVLREDLAGDRDAVSRFEHEARTAAGFSHPNVVTIHDFGITGRGRGFLVMERLEGRTLRAAMETGRPLGPERALSILRGLCAAVDAAHRRQLVHRDLKPENVFLALVDGVETPKILDFGIAKPFRPAAEGPRETAAGVLVGTPEYMAPEQLRGEDVSASWDLWALAVMAYEMVSGRHPFSAAVARGGVPGFPAAHAVVLAEGLPADLRERSAAFFARALAIDPAGRPPSAAAFSAELTGILIP